MKDKKIYSGYGYGERRKGLKVTYTTDTRPVQAIVEAAKCLGPNGILYVERSGVLTSPEVLDQQKLVRLRSMSAGQVTCELLGFAAGSLAALAKVKKPLRGKAAKIAAKQAQKALKVKFNALIASLTSDQLWLMHGQD